MIIIASSVWECGRRDAFITLDLFFDMMLQIKL